MAADAAGTASSVARFGTLGSGMRPPQALRSPKLVRVWGAVCFVAGLAFAVQAAFNENF